MEPWNDGVAPPPGRPHGAASRPTVVHVSTVHDWDDARIFRKMCVSLARAGYDVVLLAVSDAAEDAAVEPVHGVRIISVPRARNRLTRLLVTVPRTALRARRLRSAVYHLHDPETIPTIPFLRAGGARVVYDAHEDLRLQVLEKEYIPRPLRRTVAAVGRVLCALADRSAHHVVAASTTVADGFRPATCTVVHNYPEDLSSEIEIPPYETRPRMVGYAGGLTAARGVGQMIDALRLAGLPEWRLRLVGPHSPEDYLDRLRARAGWSRVDHRPLVSPPEARRLMAECRVGFALLQPVGQNVDVVPTKLFEYMSLGVPVIASDYPACRAVVESTDCGLLVDPADPRAIAAALEELAADPERARAMGERGREAVAQRFNWEAEQAHLLGVYERLLRHRVPVTLG